MMTTHGAKPLLILSKISQEQTVNIQVKSVYKPLVTPER